MSNPILKNDLDDNKTDFVEVPISPDQKGINEKLGGSINTGPKLSSQRETVPTPGLSITVSTGEATRFRLRRTWSDASNRFLDIDGSPDVLKASLKNNGEIAKYLEANGDNLSPEARFYLQMTIEHRKPDAIPSTEDPDTEVTLSGEEAKAYKAFKLTEKFDKALQSISPSDPNISAVLGITSQQDPQAVADYMLGNWNQLSPAALDLLNASLAIKTFIAS